VGRQQRARGGASRRARRLLAACAGVSCGGLVLGLCRGQVRADVTDTWNGVTGPWSTPGDWSLGLVPNNGFPPGTNYAVVVNSGQLTLDIDPTIDDFTLNGGSLLTASPHSLSVNGLFTWTGGTIHASVGNVVR
jgi:hypothetical protein